MLKVMLRGKAVEGYNGISKCRTLEIEVLYCGKG